MIPVGDLSQGQRGLLAVGAILSGVALGALLSVSELDLMPLRILRSVQTGSGGDVLETQYNPFALLGLAVIALAIIAGCGLILAWLAPKFANAVLGGGAAASGSQVEVAGKKLDRQLSQVLELIRGYISTNESYAKSLASAQSRLTTLPEGEQVRVIVSLLVAENERMRRDSTELKSKLEDSKKQVESLRTSLSQAEEVVLKDPLTGVGNRRCFDIVMEKSIGESSLNKSPLSLIMCDIDHFKRVNDAFGHQVGDEIIKMFSRIIESNVRDGDSVVRYGGEEFAIILPSTDQDGASSIAERVRRQFEAKKLTIRETSQKIGQMTASFGVAQYRTGDDMEMLVQRADAKLYDAKAGGRNRVAVYGKSD